MKVFWSLLLGVTALTLHAETATATAEPVSLLLKDGTQLTVSATYDVSVAAQKPAEAPRRKAALFVQNVTREAALDQVCKVIAAQLGAQVAGTEVEILNASHAVHAMDPTTGGAQQATLEGNTSMLRLAENMGADYALIVSLDRFSKNTQRIKDRRFGKAADGSGASIVNEVYKVSGSYTITDVYSGSAFDGGTLKAQKSIRQTSTVENDFGSYADGLEEELVTKMAAEIRQKSPTWREASLAKSGIPVTFKAIAYDLNNQPIYLPMLSEENAIRNTRMPSEVAATIEVDGVAKGTSGCTIRMSRGLHNVRIRREGYEDVTMTVVPSDGLSLTVGLMMTAREYARVKDSIEFMHNLTVEREQSQATVVERLGHAKMLEQSGFLVKTDKLPDVITTPVMTEWIVPVKKEVR